MTYTILMFITRKEGMAPPQFKHHMETYHIPLVQSITGPNFPNRSTRRYVQRNSNDTANLPKNDNSNANWVAPSPFGTAYGTKEEMDIDAVFQLDFDDEAACKKFVEIINQEDAQRKLAADEELFLNRGKLRIVVQGKVNVTER